MRVGFHRCKSSLHIHTQEDFDAAAALAGKIATASGITNDEKLEMYSLFKQASEGDCTTGE
jgi:acyl-CoA-binding protein